MCAAFEEGVEIGEVVITCGDRSGVDAVFYEKSIETFTVSFGEFRKSHARAAVGGVDEDLLAGFGVAEVDFANVGEVFFEGVNNGEGDDVVLTGEGAEWFFKAPVDEVRDEEDETLSLIHI